MNRKTTGIIAILACFMAGAAAGICGHSLWLKYKFENRERPIPYALEDREQEMMIHRLEKDLNLSQDQVKKLHKIAENSSKAFKEFFDKNRPVMEQLVEDFENQINSILTDDQITHFQELKKRQRKMMRMPAPPREYEIKNPEMRIKAKEYLINKVYGDFDKNADGFMDKTETPPFLVEEFDRFDIDKDGKISKKEFEIFLKRAKERMPKDLIDHEMEFPEGCPPPPPPEMDRHGPPPPHQEFE